MMENITFVMTKTANSFFDIMKMPAKVFFCILKHLQIIELSQNPEWCKKYTEWQVLQQHKEGKVKKQGVSLSALQMFGSKL